MESKKVLATIHHSNGKIESWEQNQMEFKGTKGPWKIKGNINLCIYGIELINDLKLHDPVCTINDFDKTITCKKANAKLISKAPELLEELKHVLRALKAVNSMGATKTIIENAEKLIKDATEIK